MAKKKKKMQYYSCSVAGDGTEENPYRPDVPAGTDYASNSDGGRFIIATYDALTTSVKIENLTIAEAETLGKAMDAEFDLSNLGVANL